MINPPISDLLNKVKDRYTLVIATAKRARQLTNGEPPLIRCSSTKDVSVAIQEIYDGKVTYRKKSKKNRK